MPRSKSPALPVSAKRLPLSKSPAPPPPTHGGARANAGRHEAPYKRKNITVDLPEPLIDQWNTHCADKNLSRAESLAKWLKWKKPGRKK